MPVAPIPAHELPIFLLQAGLLLLLASSFGRLALRLGLPAVVGELFVGVLLGPSVLIGRRATARDRVMEER